MDYEIKLDVFEGPLDLLLHLIRKNEVDIFDIPIASITDQYLEYLDMMKALNMDIAGDFLVMASTLVHIKSRMLLPSHGEEGDEEDPRMEIARPLLEYMLFKQASEELNARPMLEREVFVRRPPQELEPQSIGAEIPLQVNLFQLMDAFRRVLERSRPETVLTFSREEWSMKERMEHIIHTLITRKTMFFEDLFGEDRTISELVATFLALLELVNRKVVSVFQPGEGSMIQVFLKEQGGEPAA